MKLKTVRVTNYRSVEDSEDVSIADVTCLVGKNESGKTAFLRAVHLLNPVNPIKGKTTYDEAIDYPSKHYAKYKKVRKENPATVVTAAFELTDEEMQQLESKYGAGVLSSRRITVESGYGPKKFYNMKSNEAVTVSKLLEGVELTEADSNTAESLDTIVGLVAFLEGVEEPHSSVTSLLTALTGWREQRLNLHLIDEYLSKWLPQFFYFDDYSVMEGRINFAELRSRQSAGTLTESDKTFLALLTTIDASLDDFEADSDDREENERLVRELEAASNALSQEVFEYWSQNKSLRVQFQVEPNGKYMNVRIYNERHAVSVPFDERSRGFIWFFSFFAYFSNLERDINRELILLLDEPGLSLHAKAQEDFLKLINERLAPEHQVIYSTHSPFMVEPSRLDRVRTVEDVDGVGTKISADVLRTDKDTVFPLQAALGYDLAQTLFIGPNTLLVEGPSDLIYLQILTQLLTDNGREGLDERWVIVPVGGADKLATFVSLMGANQLNIAVLMDIAGKDTQRVQRLQENGFLSKGSLLTIGQFTGAKDADIEDVFEPAFYLSLVNGAYKAKLAKAVTQTDIKTGNPRIAVRLEDYFNTQGLKFSHFPPAAYLLNNQPKLLTKINDATLQTAEDMFKAVNKLIP